jgi:flagellar hook-length control protein FliK
LAASPAAVDGRAKPADGTASQPVAAATATTASAPVSNDATPNATAAVPDTDTAAQLAMAAALAQGSSAPQTNSASADLMATDLSAAPAGGAAAAGLPATGDSGANSGTVTAATAAAIAQVVSAVGGAAGADKHSRGGGGSDSFLPGASSDGSAAAQLLSSAGSSVADSAPTATFKVSAGVDSAEFGQGVSDRVGIMMDGNLTSAKLQVNPPALGPIEVRIALQAGHAQVWFTSHSAVTRDALESSAPKLREMLGAQGFGQVSVDISQRSFQDRSPPPRGYAGAPAMAADSVASAAPSSAMARAANGLLDAYA